MSYYLTITMSYSVLLSIFLNAVFACFWRRDDVVRFGIAIRNFHLWPLMSYWSSAVYLLIMVTYYYSVAHEKSCSSLSIKVCLMFADLVWLAIPMCKCVRTHLLPYHEQVNKLWAFQCTMVSSSEEIRLKLG